MVALVVEWVEWVWSKKVSSSICFHIFWLFFLSIIFKPAVLIHLTASYETTNDIPEPSVPPNPKVSSSSRPSGFHIFWFYFS
jgi:hypothetical protein